MFPKLLVSLLAAAFIAAMVLEYRQQRLEMMHEMAQLHRQIDTLRQETWDLQVRIAGELEPRRLGQALGRSGLALRPLVPTNIEPGLLMMPTPQDEPQPDDAGARDE